MSKVIRVPVTHEPEALFVKAKAAAGENGIIFTGDAYAGTFDGMGLSGRYVLENQELALTVESKPMIMPWGLIESTVKKFFAGT
jgi:hypothetical protein